MLTGSHLHVSVGLTCFYIHSRFRTGSSPYPGHFILPVLKCPYVWKTRFLDDFLLLLPSTQEIFLFSFATPIIHFNMAVLPPLFTFLRMTALSDVIVLNFINPIIQVAIFCVLSVSFVTFSVKTKLLLYVLIDFELMVCMQWMSI